MEDFFFQFPKDNGHPSPWEMTSQGKVHAINVAYGDKVIDYCHDNNLSEDENKIIEFVTHDGSITNKKCVELLTVSNETARQRIKEISR